MTQSPTPNMKRIFEENLFRESIENVEESKKLGLIEEEEMRE